MCAIHVIALVSAYSTDATALPAVANAKMHVSSDINFHTLDETLQRRQGQACLEWLSMGGSQGDVNCPPLLRPESCYLALLLCQQSQGRRLDSACNQASKQAHAPSLRDTKRLHIMLKNVASWLCNLLCASSVYSSLGKQCCKYIAV